MRVSPRVTVTWRFIASFTRRSASLRIASFDIGVAFWVSHQESDLLEEGLRRLSATISFESDAF
jgi:hypothetical protein